MQMKSGNGESSYANNSALQKTVMQRAWPVVEHTIREMFYGGDAFQPKYFSIADMGSSSGPNTPFIISNIITTLLRLCRQRNLQVPEIQVSLNDLLGNDFNTLFQSLPPLYDELNNDIGEDVFNRCFISGVPGSFYNRLFPEKSLHFVHSSYSLHWLSQVPKGLVNKGNIYMGPTWHPEVFRVYFDQYKEDFSTFLSLRSQEMAVNGRMVITLIGRSNKDPGSNDQYFSWTLLIKSLYNIAAEGLVEEAQVDSFSAPIYMPYKDEVKAIVEMEGSFNIDRLETFLVNWDGEEDNDLLNFDQDLRGKNATKCMRAVMEPLLVKHFGFTSSSSVIERTFELYARHAAEHLAVERTKVLNIIISLSKKKYSSRSSKNSERFTCRK